MVLGSGAAALVLEDLETARAAGKRIYAEWLGGGFTSDGWKVTLPDVASGRYADAMRQALKSAGIRARDVTLLTPHGVGTGLYDRFEAASLAEIFGNGGTEWPPMMILKGAVGHTLGGCALIETVASILAVNRGSIPASTQCSQLDASLPLGRPRAAEHGAKWVLLKTTNGFAGQNGAIVLSSAGP